MEYSLQGTAAEDAYPRDNFHGGSCDYQPPTGQTLDHPNQMNPLNQSPLSAARALSLAQNPPSRPPSTFQTWGQHRQQQEPFSGGVPSQGQNHHGNHRQQQRPVEVALSKDQQQQHRLKNNNDNQSQPPPQQQLPPARPPPNSINVDHQQPVLTGFTLPEHNPPSHNPPSQPEKYEHPIKNHGVVDAYEKLTTYEPVLAFPDPNQLPMYAPIKPQDSNQIPESRPPPPPRRPAPPKRRCGCCSIL